MTQNIYIKNLTGIFRTNVSLLLLLLVVNSCNKEQDNYDSIFISAIAEISENSKDVDFYQRHMPPPKPGEKYIRNEYINFYVDNNVTYDKYYSENLKYILSENDFDDRYFDGIPFRNIKIKSRFISRNNQIIINQLKTDKTINLSFLNFRQKGNNASFILNEQYNNSIITMYIVVEKIHGYWKIKNSLLIGRS
ncbi:hypothetical protein AAH994_14660 [Weeksellaceae bacterium A-14]